MKENIGTGANRRIHQDRWDRLAKFYCEAEDSQDLVSIQDFAAEFNVPAAMLITQVKRYRKRTGKLKRR
jgi:hypothetical protein